MPSNCRSAPGCLQTCLARRFDPLRKRNTFVLTKKSLLFRRLSTFGIIKPVRLDDPELILREMSPRARSVGIVIKVIRAKSAFSRTIARCHANWFDPDLEVKFTTNGRQLNRRIQARDFGR